MAESTREPVVKSGDIPARSAQTLILNFGSRSKRRIKELRRGEGRLLERVNEAVAEFRRDGTLDAASPVVIVVVKERNEESKGLFG